METLCYAAEKKRKKKIENFVEKRADTGDIWKHALEGSLLL
jgi:hypothetical protein